MSICLGQTDDVESTSLSKHGIQDQRDILYFIDNGMHKSFRPDYCSRDDVLGPFFSLQHA